MAVSGLGLIPNGLKITADRRAYWMKPRWACDRADQGDLGPAGVSAAGVRVLAEDAFRLGGGTVRV
jgi:hypothetical protein